MKMRFHIKMAAVLFTFLIPGILAAQKQTILFEERFDNNAKNWQTGEDEWAIKKIKGGKYYYECKGYLNPNSGTSWSCSPGFSLPPGNVIIECKTKWIKNRNDKGYYNGYGFFVGDYSFQLYGNGDHTIHKWDGTKDVAIVDFSGDNPSLFTGAPGEVNVKIEFLFGRVNFYGNDILLYSGYFSYKGGKFCLVTRHSEIVEFDDIVISKYDEPNLIININKNQGMMMGKQQWMRYNLDVSKFRNGDPIPYAATEEQWIKAAKEGKPAWCYLENDSAKYSTCGKIYNWYAVNDKRGLAPAGWRVSNESDWRVLNEFMKSKEGTREASAGYTFNASQCGWRLFRGNDEQDGRFYVDGGYWWTPVSSDSGTAIAVEANYSGFIYATGPKIKGMGFYVRCIKE